MAEVVVESRGSHTKHRLERTQVGRMITRCAIGDTVVITEEGYEHLSTGLPRTVQEIEDLMREPGLLQKVRRWVALPQRPPSEPVVEAHPELVA